MPDDHGIVRHEVEQGLIYAHTRTNLNAAEILQLLARLDALFSILVEQGVVDAGDLEERRHEAEERLRKSLVEKGMSVALIEHETSKYDFEPASPIDCESRVHLCRAACCRLGIALSKEDVEEGVLRWDLGNPYFIGRAEDGSCVHLDPESRCCGVYAARPIPCRGFDCRKDERIWRDFEKMVPNPKVAEPGWPQVLDAKPSNP